MATKIRETTSATVAPAAPGKIKVGLITPGVGSSGYYSAEVLENAAHDKVWPKGTHVYFDHPSESEMYDRPERSVRDLAAVLAEDAYWDGSGLVAEANVIGPYRDLVTDPVFVESVGMSIRALAESRAGEVDGKKVSIITRLEEGLSVDLVTHAGRGGKVLAVLESARAQIREATSNDVRDALQTAVQDAISGERSYAWVRDFDQDAGHVYFTVDDEDGSGTYQQSYELADDGTASLTGDRAEVNVRTEYVPVQPTASSDANEADGSTDQTTNVPAPAGQSTATESEETHMATTQIEESRLAQLEKDSERVQSLESERDADRTALSEAHRVIDNGEAHTIVRTAAREADISLNDFEAAGIAADYPKGEDGRIDKEKLAESAKAAVAILAESRGAGSITGFGSTAATVSSDVVAEAEEASAAAFGRTITKEA